jgi:hypothetical protein
MMKKRLQVFVSSTYTDLLEDRQAAVAAILKAGHIPAGMELFAAGDESQLQTIRRWIDESDAFMLILGGRYGSLEPHSKLSYTELEYDYAVQSDKPFFAVVMTEAALDERVRARGRSILEADYPAELKAFREKVLSRTSAFFTDARDIRLAVHETLSDFVARYEFSGWVSGAEVPDTKALVDRVSQLTEENKRLASEINSLQQRIASVTEHAGHEPTFDEIAHALGNTQISIPSEIRGEDWPETATPLRLLTVFGDRLLVGINNNLSASNLDLFLYHKVMPKLQLYDLADTDKVAGMAWRRFALTKKGARFLRYAQERGKPGAPMVAPAPKSNETTGTRQSRRRKPKPPEPGA